MNHLPTTSEKNYLTGQAALNVPTEGGDFADWHFTEVFISGRGKLPVAGRDLPDSGQYLGNYGVRECSDILRQHGVNIAPGQKVYVASHVRAALDIVLSAVSKGKVPHHITIEDTLDSPEDQKELQDQISNLRSRITDQVTLSFFNQWILQN